MATVVQTVATVVLVRVTIRYVALTDRISKASEHSVEEMRAQRVAGVQPLVLPGLHVQQSIDAKATHVVMTVILTNVGNGPAIRPDGRLVLGGVMFAPDTLASPIVSIAPGELPAAGPPRMNFLRSFPHGFDALPMPMAGQFELTYEDVYARTFRVVTPVTLDYAPRRRQLRVTAGVPRSHLLDTQPPIAVQQPRRRWWQVWRHSF